MLGEMSGAVVEVAICSAHKSVNSNNQSPANSGGGLQPANQPLPSPVLDFFMESTVPTSVRYEMDCKS